MHFTYTLAGLLPLTRQVLLPELVEFVLGAERPRTCVQTEAGLLVGAPLSFAYGGDLAL